MTGTGPGVAWVIGARFETEAEAGADSPVARFVREIGDARLMLMSPARFDDAMIRAYLEGRLGGPGFGDEQVDMIARFTRGLPLAVSLTATLLGQGQQVGDVCREDDHGYPGSVVSSLARRYLVHAERQEYPAGDPRRDDVMKILGLALAYGDVRSDPDLLAALWDTTDPLAAFTDLARRHDFVLPVSRRLHDDVRDTLRADLLDPYRRARVRPVSQRALALFSTRLTHMRGRWPTLDEQLDHAGYTTAVLAALWHALWTGNQAGLDLLARILPVLAVADPAAADAAAVMTGQFEPAFDDDQRRDLDLLTQAGQDLFLDELLAGPQGTPAGTARRAKITLPGLDLRSPGPAADATAIGTPADREAAVMILRAGIQAENHHDQQAIATLRAAAAQTASTRLRQAIGSRANEIAQQLIWAGPGGAPVPSPVGLEAAELATRMRPDLTSAWINYAVALSNAGRYEGALAAYDQAIALDPRDASAHSNRGVALAALGRYEGALAAYDRAIALDPREATAHENKGIVLAETGKFDRARAELDTADRLRPDGAGEGRAWAGAILWHQREPARARDLFELVRGRVTWCTPFRTAEMEAIALCGLGQPDSAEQRLLSAIRLLVPGDRDEPRAIYDLLSDPPLPGIGRLRAIVEQQAAP